MDSIEEKCRLLKTVNDVERLRYNVSMMSYIAQSLTLMPIPLVYRGNDDD